MVINKPLEDITESDLQQLVQNATLEKRHLEYKRELPSDAKESRIKFLAQLSSLANGDGGDLIIGITEDRTSGAPKELSGIEIANPDQEVLRLQQMAQFGISPRMIANLTSIKLENGKYAIVVRIPPSWRRPHRVTLEGHDKFYARDSAGKHLMDVDELRNAFLLTDSARKSLISFRDERIFAIRTNDTPEQLDSTARTILHLIPLVSISRPLDINIKEIGSSTKYYRSLNPIGHLADSRRYNYEGYITHVPSQPGTSTAYLQLFRNGIIESVEAGYFENNLPDKKYVAEAVLESGIIRSITEYFALYRDLEIPPPIFVCLTLLGFKEHSLPHRDPWNPFPRFLKFGRDILRFPERVIEDLDESAESIMRPIFNAIWNAAGYSEDLYYGKDGVWKNPGG